MFGKYVSPHLVKRMAESGDGVSEPAREVEITPFFASIHGYVGLAEQLPLSLLPELMNRYFSACTDQIQAEGGTLDKYIGDAVIAMWGTGIDTGTRLSRLRSRDQDAGGDCALARFPGE